MNPPGERFVKPSQVSAKLGLTKNQIYDLVITGELEAIRIGPRALRISEASLDQFIEKQRV